MFETDDVMAILPHRYPMLLVDRVDECEPGVRVRARKAVSATEHCYADLDGDHPSHAYPAVLLVESWCQAAAILVTVEDPQPDPLTGDVMLFGSLSGVRLGAEVRPGDVMTHEVRVVRALAGSLVVEGESSVDGTPVLTVEQVLITRRPASDLRREHVPG